MSPPPPLRCLSVRRRTAGQKVKSQSALAITSSKQIDSKHVTGLFSPFLIQLPAMGQVKPAPEELGLYLFPRSNQSQYSRPRAWIHVLVATLVRTCLIRGSRVLAIDLILISGNTSISHAGDVRPSVRPFVDRSLFQFADIGI